MAGDALEVALVQHEPTWEARDATLAALDPVVAGLGAADLVLLPELFATGFTLATDRCAEPEGGPTARWLAGHAAALDAWVGGSVVEVVPGAARPRNTLVLAGPDGTAVRYAKRHPFTFAGEQHHVDAGDDLVTAAVGGVRLGLAVCYDLRFADQFWAQGPHVDAFAVVASWPAARAAHWRALLVARAIENQAWVLAVNRVGPDGHGVAHAGGSLVIDPLGRVVAEAGDRAEVLRATVDAGAVAATRRRFPFLADRRPLGAVGPDRQGSGT